MNHLVRTPSQRRHCAVAYCKSRYPPKPYQFHYSAGDGRGNSHYRNEQSDDSGVVRGTYGYKDAQGLYRVVQYVADARGFRANITTNEPGTDGKVNPAAVNILAEKPPVGIQDRGTKVRGAGTYGGGNISAMTHSVQAKRNYGTIVKGYTCPSGSNVNCEKGLANYKKEAKK